MAGPATLLRREQGDDYGQLISRWIVDSCSGETADTAWDRFCSDAGAGGLLPSATDDPFGIEDGYHCVSSGHDCGKFAVDLVTDALSAVPGVEEVDAAATEARTAGKAAEGLGKDGAEDALQGLEDGCKAANSFPGDTKVLTGDGSTSEPIEDVKIGDTVLATSPLTGETKPEKVQAVIKTLTDTDFTDLTLADGKAVTAPATELTSTQHHPYWDVTRDRWIDATDLHPGDALRLPDGHTTRITGVRDYTGHIVTYNLTVTDLHTYYVLAGATPVLVHNDDDDGFSGTVFRDGAYRFQIYSNDHGPAHGHLIGPGIKGDGIQIGQNGKPLNPNVELSRAQQQVIDNNLGA